MRLVTVHQARLLEKLGLKEYSTYRYAYLFGKQYIMQRAFKTDKRPSRMLIVPSVDEAIDFLRRKYDVTIYSSAAPFVDPCCKQKILYGFSVKFCNRKWGWNMREFLGKTKWSSDIYAAKRMAITIALRYLIKKYHGK